MSFVKSNLKNRISSDLIRPSSIKSLMNISILLAFAMSLSGCFNAATTSAQVVYQRHSIEHQVQDHLTTMQLFQALNIDNDSFKDAHIVISTFNGEILLTGQAPLKQQRTQAASLASTLPRAKKIYNLIAITTPSSTWTRLNDAWITSKIKAKLLASDDIDASQIKVVTENRTVYLMGILPPAEAIAAIDIARTTDGVRRVIKMFSYIHIDKNIS